MQLMMSDETCRNFSIFLWSYSVCIDILNLILLIQMSVSPVILKDNLMLRKSSLWTQYSRFTVSVLGLFV